MTIALLISLLPLAYWWRFKHAQLDRDYGPYAYCGVFKSGYMKNGHRDIKPPLIHWSYQLWLGFISICRLKLSTPQALRLLPMLSVSIACLLVGVKSGALISLTLALLLCSPYLWAHMANTEWLTVSLLALSMAIPAPYAWVILGLLPLVNQKNVLLIIPMAWAMGLTVESQALTVAIPGCIFILWLIFTKRWEIAKLWMLDIPKRMGKKRTFKTNVVAVLHLFIPFIHKLILIAMIVDYKSKWFVVFAIVVAMSLSVKQLVPHHFILWALPLALCSQPTPAFFAAWGVLWLLQDYPIWKTPALLYPLTFRFRGSALRDYGELLADSKEAVEWVKAHTDEGEAILVNGIENSFYLECNRPASAMQICEAQGEETPILPRVIVHSAATGMDIDISGYDHQLITPRGLYSVFTRKPSGIILGAR